jgi:hypothetical protein
MKLIQSAILAAGVAFCALAAPAQAFTCIDPDGAGSLPAADSGAISVSGGSVTACIGYYSKNLLNSANITTQENALSQIGLNIDVASSLFDPGSPWKTETLSGTGTISFAGAASMVGDVFIGVHYGNGSGYNGTAFYKIHSDTPFSAITIDRAAFSDAVLFSTGTPAVPEPASWALMIAGIGAVGFSMRRRKTAVAFA